MSSWNPEEEKLLKVFDLMGNLGADSRLEAYGLLEQALEPDMFLEEGPKVDAVRDKVLRGFGNLLNRFGHVKKVEGSKIGNWVMGREMGSYLSLESDTVLPSVKRGNYPAVVLIENNPKVVEDGHKPTWQEGELLAITIKSMHLNNEDDFTFEVIVDSKQGGVVYINGGGSASLDLGDYMTLDILLEDIDR